MERLVEAVQRIATERSQRFVGRTMDVLVEGPSRTDPARLRGRIRHGKTVNFEANAERP
ncbi:TRAM domain-containing protein, partial [Escherichia coli]|nr:TRAM domain-containing protein [Escherichia coli]